MRHYGQWNTQYLRGADPAKLRDDLMSRTRSNASRSMRAIDNRVNYKWFRGNPYFIRLPSTTQVVGMDPARRRGFLFPNLIRDVVRTLTSVMTYDPDVDAFPQTSDPGDIIRAEMDQHVARAIIQEGALGRAQASVGEMVNLYGDGYIKVLWDPDLGSRRPIVHADVCPICSNTAQQQTSYGMPFTGGGPGSGIIYTAQGPQSCFFCEAQGMVATPQGEQQLPLGHIGKYVGTRADGDVSFVAVHPDDVFPDPDATTWEECEEVCHRIRMSPQRAWSRYGEALGIPEKFFRDMPADIFDERSSANTVMWTRPADTRYLVISEYYARPSEQHPEGLFVVSCGNQVIYADSLPYLHDKQWNPLFRFEMYKSEGEFYAQSTVDLILPLVLAYADQFSAGHFRAKESARMRWMIPDSSGLRSNNDTGHVHYRDQPGRAKPETVNLGPIPADASEMRQVILEMIDRISGAQDILRGSAGGAETGVAMSFLEERAVGPLRPIIQNHAKVLDDVIRYGTEMAKLQYEDGRLIRMRGESGAIQVKEFRVDDAGSGADVRLHAVKNVGRSRASQMAELNEAAAMQMVDKETYQRLAQFGDMQAQFDAVSPQRNMAVNEHDTLRTQGDMPMPLQTENHNVHIEEHSKEINSRKMRGPNDPAIGILLQHVEIHRQMQAKNDIQAQIYQQQAMAEFGAANAANPDFQPQQTQEATQEAGAPSATASPGQGTPPSEPFVNEMGAPGDQANYTAAMGGGAGEF